MRRSRKSVNLDRRVRRQLSSHLRGLGFKRIGRAFVAPPLGSKDAIRGMHRIQRRDRLVQQAAFVDKQWPRLHGFFANGEDVDVSNIEPRLELIDSDTWQSDLFRLSGLTWAVPVSQGFGRRLRFLVWDDHIGKLLGIIGLCDPVFNLKARDKLIGWSSDERKERLVHALDAYVLGAVPPYNKLLGGKLVACLVRTKAVAEAFNSRYSKACGVISGRLKRANLAIVTTASALGRSSIYNRLVLEGVTYFKPIGFTTGWGHFQIPGSLFELMREQLRLSGHRYANNHQFGQGPNWRLRATREALRLAKIDPTVLRHGISRELFVCELADNAKELLRGVARTAKYTSLATVETVGEQAIDRWLKPRAARDASYRDWRSDEIREYLTA